MDMNGVVDTRKQFRKALDETMSKIAIDTYQGTVDQEETIETINPEYERFFNSMKGATNIHMTDVEELVEAEIKRQKELYIEIEKLKPVFDSVKTLEPSGLAAFPHWNHGPSRGLNININGVWFYASPRVPCSTDEYITVKQAPVPANIVMINKAMILMLPYGEDPSEKTRKQLNTLIPASGQITEEGFKDPIRVRTNYLWIHSEETIDNRLINSVMEKYGADAFMVGYPGRNIALIYTGLEDSIEQLWRTLYFDWGDMWRRYS